MTNTKILQSKKKKNNKVIKILKLHSMESVFILGFTFKGLLVLVTNDIWILFFVRYCS